MRQEPQLSLDEGAKHLARELGVVVHHKHIREAVARQQARTSWIWPSSQRGLIQELLKLSGPKKEN